MECIERADRAAPKESRWLARFAIACVLAAPLDAGATVMRAMDLEDLVDECDAIARGVVERTTVHAAPGGLRPFTATELLVTDALKGALGARLIIRELGGAIDGRRVVVLGTPRYEVGEEVLVFLRDHPDAPGAFRTCGMTQGRFTIRRGTPGVPTVAFRQLEGALVAPDGSRSTSRSVEVPVPLDDLLRRIELLLAVRR